MERSYNVFVWFLKKITSWDHLGTLGELSVFAGYLLH